MTKIIFIHGSGCTGEAFAFQTAAFEGSTAPNLPGHEAPGSAATVTEFADFIERLCTERTILAGNSLGGAIALEVALRKNPAVAAIILIGSGSRLRVAPAILEGLANDFEATTHMLARSMFAQADPALVADVVATMKRIGPEQIVRDFQACNAFDVTPRLGELAVPALALTGQQDVMTPPKYAQALADRVRGAQVRIIPGAGHLAMIEQPAATNAAIRNFVHEVG